MCHRFEARTKFLLSLSSLVLSRHVGADLCFERKYGGVDGRRARDKRRRRKTTETRTRGECREEKITLAQSDRVAVAGKVLYILYLKGARRPQSLSLSLSLSLSAEYTCVCVSTTHALLTLSRLRAVLAAPLVLSFSRVLSSRDRSHLNLPTMRAVEARVSLDVLARYRALLRPGGKTETQRRNVLTLSRRKRNKKGERNKGKKKEKKREACALEIYETALDLVCFRLLRCDSKRSVSSRLVASRRRNERFDAFRRGGEGCREPQRSS